MQHYITKTKVHQQSHNDQTGRWWFRQPTTDNNHKTSSRMSLLSARPTVTFPASERHRHWPAVILLLGEQRHTGHCIESRSLHSVQITSPMSYTLCHHCTQNMKERRTLEWTYQCKHYSSMTHLTNLNTKHFVTIQHPVRILPQQVIVPTSCNAITSQKSYHLWAAAITTSTLSVIFQMRMV